MFIDTHCHLNFKAFHDTYREAIKRAFQANVKSIINVGSNMETSESAIKIAKEYGIQTSVFKHQLNYKNINQVAESSIYAAIGLHPIHVKDEQFDYSKYLKLARDKHVVAIGETGVDLYHDKNSINIQHDIFQKSLRIAMQVEKPVIIHSRDGEEDLRAWLMGEQNLPSGVVHCFQGDLNFAEFLIDLGFLISFTGIITFTKNQKTLEVIKEIPLDKIIIETDSPYLAPEPYRSEPIRQAQGAHAKSVRNEPAYVVEVAKKIAEIKNITIQEVEEVTTLTARELFGII